MVIKIMRELKKPFQQQRGVTEVNPYPCLYGFGIPYQHSVVDRKCVTIEKKTMKERKINA